MPSVTISEYEWSRDQLPAVCAKCGQPAAERVPHRLRYMKDDWKIWKPIGVAIGAYFVPLLCILIVWRYAQVVQVRIPMCVDHRDDFAWRDRISFRFLLPAWVLAAFALYLCALVACLNGFAGALFLLGIPFTSIAVPIIEIALIRRTGVQAAFNQRKRTVRLSGVHADFVTAIVEDRARSRVWDPERRGTGDIKEDYDDEPV